MVTKTVVSGQIDLPANHYRYFPFTVPEGAINVYLKGNTKVVGGILSNIAVGLFYANNCPSTGSTVPFLKGKCQPIKYGLYGNNDSFALYIPSGQKYYIIFLNLAPLGEEKIIKPTVTVTYNK